MTSRVPSAEPSSTKMSSKVSRSSSSLISRATRSSSFANSGRLSSSLKHGTIIEICGMAQASSLLLIVIRNLGFCKAFSPRNSLTL